MRTSELKRHNVDYHAETMRRLSKALLAITSYINEITFLIVAATLTEPEDAQKRAIWNKELSHAYAARVYQLPWLR
nr:hypothetical protein CFP56_58097 [Quercus suber]